VNKQTRKQVLFLCTGNSCRSQMAEGWANHLLSDSIQAHSAGTNPQSLNQIAVSVMAEVGVDISQNYSKHLDEFQNQQFDLIVTVCDNAAENCPILGDGCKVIHQPFDDPPHLAEDADSESATLAPYRRVRDELKEFILRLPGIL
jgi:arsenate reductase (thioredoxin)